jgi:SAM-dependent methyltransferase
MSFAPLPKILRDRLAGLDPATAVVVELGCGDGRFARELRPLGVPVVGLDRGAPGTGVEAALTADALRPPLRPASCDLVIAANLVRHLADAHPRLEFLPVWAGLLRPGGSLFILEDEPSRRPRGAVAYRLLQDFLARVVPGGRGPLLGLGDFRDRLAAAGLGGAWEFGGDVNRYPLDGAAAAAMLRGADLDPDGEAARLADRIARDGLDPGRYWWACLTAGPPEEVS